MITVESLLYNLDLKLNNLASFEHQSVPTENKLILLNLAQIKLIKTKISPNNIYGIGYDGFRKRYEDLQVLAESAHDHNLPLKEVDTKLHKWEADLNELAPQYMFYIDSYATASKGKCKEVTIFVNNDLTKHSDVQMLLSNTNARPSFEYQETFNTISNNKIELYTDGSFTFDEVFISYVRYPKEIDIAGYEHLDGTDSVTQHCELPNYLEEELLNLAIEEIAYITTNPAAQFSQPRIKSQE